MSYNKNSNKLLVSFRKKMHPDKSAHVIDSHSWIAGANSPIPAITHLVLPRVVDSLSSPSASQKEFIPIEYVIQKKNPKHVYIEGKVRENTIQIYAYLDLCRSIIQKRADIFLRKSRET